MRAPGLRAGRLAAMHRSSEPVHAPGLLPFAPALRGRSALHLAHLDLGGCVRAYMSRDTLGLGLAGADLLNHFPASPACSISWVVQGEADWVAWADEHEADPDGCERRPLGMRVMLTGPQTRPTVYHSPGDGLCFMVVAMPDALHELTGVDMSACVDRVLPFDAVFEADWRAMSQCMLSATDDLQRVSIFESFVLPRWRQLRRAQPGRGHYLDWVQGLAVRAALSGFGRSVRQVERRIKAWAGQSQRHLRSLARAEQSFLRTREAVLSGRLSWAETATAAGYADQAHLCRDTRRVCGVTPGELHQRIFSRESYWPYRTWA